MGHGATPLQTSQRVFEQFLAPDNPGREWGRMLALHIQDAGEYALYTTGGIYKGSGPRRIALGLKKPY